jgi:hypothetical protein
LKFWTRTDWLIVLIFAILVAIFYWRILTPNPANRQSFPPGDFHAQFWAFTTCEVRELSAGRLPLWNPYTFAGAPFWADVQAAVFYPPSLLTLLLSAPWGFSLFALEVEAIAHFWLAAVFMYLFMREVTHSRPAALIAALTFTFSGYLTGYPSQQLAVLEVDVWLPLSLFFIHRSRSQASLPLLILAGVAWGMALLAGHPQSALITAYVSSAYFFFLWLTRPKNDHRPLSFALLATPATAADRRTSRSKIQNLKSKIANDLARAFGHWLLFLATGFALAAIQFIPAVEYTMLSVRAEGAYDRMSGGFPISDIIQLLLPGQVSFYSPLYIGVAGLILALWVTFVAPTRQTTFWAIVAFISLLISFGGNTFFYSPLYLFAPGLSIFRGQERWAFATAFSLSVLAGYGFKQLLMNNDQLSKTLDQAANITFHVLRFTQYLFFFALLLTFLFFYGLNDTGWTPDSPFYGLLGAATRLTILVALTWLLWRFSSYLHPAALTGLTAALICFDLFSVNWKTNLYPQLPEWHTQTPAIVEAIKRDAAQFPNEPYRVYNEFRLYDNYGVPYAIEDLWGGSPLRPDRYDKFLAPPMPIERAWELLNVRYVITWRETLYLPATIIYQEPAHDGTTYIHRLEKPGPRAWLVTQAEVAGDAEILQKLADPEFDRWHLALLEPAAKPYIGAFEPVKVQQVAAELPHVSRIPRHAAHITYRVTTSAPALLILSEPHYPGWQTTLDGQAAPLLRADYILQAVPLPAGEHTIELIFRPLSFTIGASLSALALIALMITFTRLKFIQRGS